MTAPPLFSENKEQLIKAFDIGQNMKIQYLINTFLNIMTRWRRIRIYVYDIDGK